MKIPAWSKRNHRRTDVRRTKVKRSRRSLIEALENRQLLAVITVDTLATTAAGDGLVSFEEAIEAANSDTSVDGSVAGSGADTIEFAPALNGTVLLSQEVAITSPITIDGDGRITLDGNQVNRIFNATSGDPEFALSDLTLIGGTPLADSEGGGAILFDSTGTLSLTGVTLRGNAASGSGGGVMLRGGSLDVNNSLLEGNSVTINGGAIAALAGTVVTITDSTIDANSADEKGGGIFTQGSVEILRTTVSGNSTSSNNGYGGGIYVGDGSLAVTESTISGNSTAGAAADGGGIFSNTNLTGSSTTIIQSTISGNTSGGRGGGIFNIDGETNISYSTVTANTAPNNGGVTSYADTNTRTTVASSIIAGNNGGDVESVGGITSSFQSSAYNVIGTGNGAADFNAAGDQVNVADPMVGGLADNGGPTQTHALLAGTAPRSIRAIRPLTMMNCLTTNADSRSRVWAITESTSALSSSTPAMRLRSSRRSMTWRPSSTRPSVRSISSSATSKRRPTS